MFVNIIRYSREHAKSAFLERGHWAVRALEQELKKFWPLIIAIFVYEIAGNFSSDFANFAPYRIRLFVLHRQKNLLFQLNLGLWWNLQCVTFMKN